MTTDYDPIAEQYQRAKQQPWRTYVECFTLLIENYFLDRPAHEHALHEAGFREVRWHRPRLSPDASPPEYETWRPLLECPPFTFLECLR